MFRWRNKDQGFSWEKHIRTTVLYRRAKRREKIADARDVAADGLKKVGQAGHKASKKSASAAKVGALYASDILVAFALSAWKATCHYAKRFADNANIWSRWAAREFWAFTQKAANWLGEKTISLSRLIGAFVVANFEKHGPRISIPTPIAIAMAVLGTIAMVGAILHISKSGFTGDAIIATLIALPLLLVSVISLASRGQTLSLPRSLSSLPSFNINSRFVGFAVIGFLACGLTWFGLRALPSADISLGAITLSTPSETIKGRAVAITGDTLRISNRVVRLYGIEAPSLHQTCKNHRSRSWRCGRAARQALRRLVRRRTLTCERNGTTENGQAIVKCASRKHADLAQSLVRNGHVFAENSFANPYGEAESAAREKNKGIWRGKALRPAEYRTEKWNAAKKASPNGCPIKGRVLRSGRKYVLPWSPNYRRVKVRDNRGERWFCSEDEALAAGWKPYGSS